jgi:hypothetical protein
MRRVRLVLAVLVAGSAVASIALPAASRAEEHEHGAHDAAAASGAIQRTPRPADAKLYIISPANGDTVSSPVTIRFGLSGMGVAPAGVATPNTGHHHLIVDAPLPPLDKPLPKDAKHIHFGGGQTETTVELAPGPHRIRIVLADKDHVPHDPPLVSDEVSFTVK